MWLGCSILKVENLDYLLTMPGGGLAINICLELLWSLWFGGIGVPKSSAGKTTYTWIECLIGEPERFWVSDIDTLSYRHRPANLNFERRNLFSQTAKQ